MRFRGRRSVAVLAVLSAAALFAALQDGSAAASGPVQAAKAAFVVGAERAASTARPTDGQGDPAVAFNGTRYLVVWSEGSADGSTAIYAARVDPDGTVLDPNGILLGSGGPDLSLSKPAVGGGGGRWYVAWEQEPEGTYDDLAAALVGNGGAVLKRGFLSRVDNQQSNPAVAWNGRLFLAVWEDQPDVTDQEIYGARITRDGLVLDGCSSDSCPNGDDPGITIEAAPADQTLPAVAASDFFVVPWTDADVATPTDIVDTGIATNAEDLGFGFRFTISGAAGAQSEPSIARTGDRFLIAWTDRRSGAVPDIFSTLIQPGSESDFNSTPLSPNGVAVSTAVGSQSEPSAARRGTGYVVVWNDTRNGRADIFGSRVNASGAVVDPAGVAIANTPRAESNPAAVAGSGNQLVAYQRTVFQAPFNGSQRVFFRLLS